MWQPCLNYKFAPEWQLDDLLQTYGNICLKQKSDQKEWSRWEETSVQN